MQVVFSKSDCFPFRGAYFVSLKVSNPINGVEAEVECVLDTGFDGWVMLQPNTYYQLGLELRERPEEVFPVYRTMSGTAVFRRSYAAARLAGRIFDVEVVTPLHGAGKNLVGTRVLEGLTTLLHREEKACIGDAEIKP